MNQQTDNQPGAREWAYAAQPKYPYPSSEVMRDLGLGKEAWFQICERYGNIKTDLQYNNVKHFSDIRKPPDGVRVYKGEVYFGKGKSGEGWRLDISELVTKAIVRCLYRQRDIGRDSEDENQKIAYIGPNAVKVFEPTSYGGNPLQMRIDMTLEGLRERCRKTGTFLAVDFEYADVDVKVDIPGTYKNDPSRTVTAPKWCQGIVVKMTPNGPVKFRGPRIYFENYMQSASFAANNHPDQMFSNCAERNALRKAYTGFEEPDLGYDADAGVIDVVSHAFGDNALDARASSDPIPEATTTAAEEETDPEPEPEPEPESNQGTTAQSHVDEIPFMGQGVPEPVAEGPPKPATGVPSDIDDLDFG